MTTRLVVDTSVAVYLLKDRPPRGQEERWKSARELLQVPEADWRLALAAPALGEVLAGIPQDKQDAAAEVLTKTFDILALDYEAAKVVGRLAKAAINGRSPTLARQAVKVDVEIVACAIRWGAGGICFFDGDHDKIAARSKAKLKCGEPEMFTPSQRDLFANEEE